MIESVTVARPYAKATFELAIEHQKVSHWQSMLEFSAQVSLEKRIAKQLLSRAFSSKQLAQKFIEICAEKLDESGQNLIRIMAENKHLSVLPDVLKQFILLRSKQENFVEVSVISNFYLKKEQLKKISIAMEQRLSQKVKLNCKFDKSIIAGVVICTGDMVIDGSLRNRFKCLSNILRS